MYVNILCDNLKLNLTGGCSLEAVLGPQECQDKV